MNLLCASKPEYNDKFSVLAQMAPVFFAQYMQQPVMRLSATLHADEVSQDTDTLSILPWSRASY